MCMRALTHMHVSVGLFMNVHLRVNTCGCVPCVHACAHVKWDGPGSWFLLCLLGEIRGA